LFDELLDFVAAIDLGDRRFMGITPFFADIALSAFGFWVVAFDGGEAGFSRSPVGLAKLRMTDFAALNPHASGGDCALRSEAVDFTANSVVV
jgi:hypothetical protein